MAAKRPILGAPSALGSVWDLGEDGSIKLAEASTDDAKAAEAWECRFVDWSWTSILVQSHETFVFHQKCQNVALWASQPKRLLELPEHGSCYRLDFVELAPHHRGTVLSYYAAAIIAARALEAGANAIVLASLPGSVRFWCDVVGAVKGPIRGWHVPGTLLPCLIPRAVMEDLRSDADACKKA